MDRTSDYTVVRTHDGAYRLDRVTDPYPGPVANITPVRDRAQTVTGWRLRPLVSKRCSRTLERSVGIRGRPVPGHQVIDATLWPAVHQPGEQIGDVGERIDAVQLTRLDERCPA